MTLHTTHPVTAMRLRLLAAAAAAVLASPALAQDAPSADTTPAPNGLRKGAWSLSFSAPGYSGSGERAEFGVWEMVGARTNLGLTLEVNVSGRDREGEEQGADQTEASTSVQLGANLRRYVSTARSVAPYVQGRVFGRGFYTRRDGLGYEETLRGVSGGLEGAVGVEWFPVRQFSVAGHTGARLSVGRLEQNLTNPNDDTERLSEYSDVIFQTFTSALSVQIYF
jgi:opacity protein-like surface antigen